MGDILTLGVAKVRDKNGNPCPPVVRGLMEGSDSSDDTSDDGEVPMMCALGLTAIPAPKDSTGHAEGNFESVPTYGSACIGARDTRCASVYGALDPGDTCLHSTGSSEAKRSRVFCKTDHVSMLVGDDCTFVIDRAAQHAILNVKGAGQVELSAANGFMAGDSSGAGIQVSSGKILLNGGQVSIPGGVHIGGSGAVPLAKTDGLLTYLGALETLLIALAGAVDSKPSPPSTVSAAVTSFISAGAAMKTAMTALFTNGK
jgi:hypothetical protein